MKTRIISALCGVIIFFIVILSPVAVMDIAMLILSWIAVYEMANALSVKRPMAFMVMSMLIPIAYFLKSLGVTFIDMNVVFYGYMLLMLAFMVLFNSKSSFSKLSGLFFSAIYISSAFYCVSLIRKNDFGLFSIMIVFIGSWVTDSCAYFAGRAFGKHKLAPVLSPKKTVEGSIGGILGTAVIITLFAIVCASVKSNMKVNVISAVVIGLICGIISQIGDLCASKIKRENEIKDYGNLMPGHGGVMDRFDSVIYCAPVVYIFLAYFPVFVK